MGSKNYREFPDSTQHRLNQGTLLRKVAQDFVLPQIISKSNMAVEVDRHRFWFYSRKTVGRRCSCWGVEDSPDAYCGVCLGKACVGAFDKFGCHTHVLDVTYPNAVAINVAPDFDAQSRPVRWSLLHKYQATKGHVEFDVPLQRRGLFVDTYQAVYNARLGESSVSLFIKALSDGDFVPLDKDSLTARLNNSSVRIRVVLKRATPEAHVPSFVYLYFRIAVRPADKLFLLGDVPRKTRSIVLQEYGLQAGLQTVPLYLPFQGVNPKAGDVFYDLEDSTAWKVVEDQNNRPLGLSVSHDLQIKFVQDNEPENRLLK
jgi:hypothetical protein